MRSEEIDQLNRLFQTLNLPMIEQLTGLDAVTPLVEKIRQDGSVFILKVDGERNPLMQQPPYTIIVSGKKLKESIIRFDTYDLLDGVTKAILAYGQKFWINP